MYAFFPKYDERIDSEDSYYPDIKGIEEKFEDACCADFKAIGNLTVADDKVYSDD